MNMIDGKRVSLSFNRPTISKSLRGIEVWQKRVWQKKLSFSVVTVPFSMSLFSMLLTGCSDLAGKASNAKNSSVADATADINADGATASDGTESTNEIDKTDKLYEALGNSYARRAAKNTSLCPKLLQRDIDNPVITRKHEYMRGQYCDYYLYPQKGQSLAINAHGANVKVFLEMPESYDFDNGPYLVKENRRHIIRVKYNGIQHKPPKFEYNIDFKLK